MRRPLRRLSRSHNGERDRIGRPRHGYRKRGRFAVPLGAAVAALLASAGPATAGTGYGQLIVNPGSAAPGQSVSVLGTCPNNGTGLRGVFSPAFVGGAASVTQTSINFSGSATIAPGASGQYTVTADCGTGSPSVTITVSGAVATPSQPVPTTAKPSTVPSAVHSSAVAMPPPTMSNGGMGGYTHAPAPSPSPTRGGGMSAGASAGMGMGAMASGTTKAMSPTPGMTSAGNGPVTSTGIVRVGLAGSSKSIMTTAGAAAIAVAAVLAGGLGFLMLRRRRRNTSGTHI